MQIDWQIPFANFFEYSFGMRMFEFPKKFSEKVSKECPKKFTKKWRKKFRRICRNDCGQNPWSNCLRNFEINGQRHLYRNGKKAFYWIFEQGSKYIFQTICQRNYLRKCWISKKFIMESPKKLPMRQRNFRKKFQNNLMTKFLFKKIEFSSTNVKGIPKTITQRSKICQKNYKTPKQLLEEYPKHYRWIFRNFLRNGQTIF